MPSICDSVVIRKVYIDKDLIDMTVNNNGDITRFEDDRRTPKTPDKVSGQPGSGTLRMTSSDKKFGDALAFIRRLHTQVYKNIVENPLKLKKGGIIKWGYVKKVDAKKPNEVEYRTTRSSMISASLLYKDENGDGTYDTLKMVYFDSSICEEGEADIKDLSFLTVDKK